MTVIQFDVRDLALGGDQPASRGRVSVVYRDASGPVSAYEVDGDKVVFGREISLPFLLGNVIGSFDVPPTIPDQVYARITIENITLGRRLISRNVIIPQTGPVAFGDLTIIDPQTFAPVVLTPTLQQTIETLAIAATRDRF